MFYVCMYRTPVLIWAVWCFRVSLHLEQPTERHARISGCGPPCINMRMRTICHRSIQNGSCARKQLQLSVGNEWRGKSTVVQHFDKLLKFECCNKGTYLASIINFHFIKCLFTYTDQFYTSCRIATTGKMQGHGQDAPASRERSGANF